MAATLPFVFLNLAISADGKIATANRAVTTLGTPQDHEHLLDLRAQADAVMAGARTVDSAQVSLGPGPARFRELRLQRGLREYNLRVIVSGSGSINPNAAVFEKQFSPIIVLTTGQMPHPVMDRLRPRVDAILVCGEETLDFSLALSRLRTEWGIERLLCEGGGRLNAALFRAGLVHEVHLTICPGIIGGHEAPTIADGEVADTLRSAVTLRLKSHRRLEDELFAVYEVVQNPTASAAGSSPIQSDPT